MKLQTHNKKRFWVSVSPSSFNFWQFVSLLLMYHHHCHHSSLSLSTAGCRPLYNFSNAPDLLHFFSKWLLQNWILKLKLNQCLLPMSFEVCFFFFVHLWNTSWRLWLPIGCHLVTWPAQFPFVRLMFLTISIPLVVALIICVFFSLCFIFFIILSDKCT